MAEISVQLEIECRERGRDIAVQHGTECTEMAEIAVQLGIECSGCGRDSCANGN